MDVRDVANGHILAAEKGRTGEAYIVSGGRVKMPELMTMLGDITGRSAAVPMIPFTLARMAAHFSPLYARLTRTKALLTDTAIHTLTTPFSISDGKACEQLGYTSLAIEQSVSDALDWYREAGYLQRQAPTPSTYARLHRKVLTFLREKFPCLSGS